MESSTDSIPKLPNDVIIEILTWLPVKSLLKFKCVCKSWLSLISSHQFAKSHLRRSRQDSTLSCHRIMLNCRGNLKQCTVPSVLCDPFIDAYDTDYADPSARNFVWVVGSCDGLICLGISRKDLILWNPSTKMFKKLPDFGVEINSGSYFAYGLGFDKSSDDYKVSGFFNSRRDSSEVTVKVYSVKSDQWKRLKNYKGHMLMDDPAAFANGKLHWITTSDWDIVFLDLETEEHGILQMPSYIKSNHHLRSEAYLRLGASEGRLFVLCSYLTFADVWIMDYGIGKETWTKAVSIPYIDDFLRFSYKQVLYVLKNGVVLLHCGSKFVIFDPQDCSYQDPVVRDCNEFFAASAYIESLVSPVMVM